MSPVPGSVADRRPQRLPRWAAAAPVLCAVHCLATPFIVLVAPNLALGESAEGVLKSASVLLAVAVLSAGTRVHRRWAVAAPVAAGVALWLIPALLPVGYARESILSAAGGASIAAGMLWNGRLRHLAVCRSCGCVMWEDSYPGRESATHRRRPRARRPR